MTVDDAIQRLADVGLLTERQAEAFVLRELELVPRQAAAESMDLSVSTLDDYVGDARRKVEAAEATLDVLEELRHKDIPDECAECGDALGSRWATDDDDRALCIDCAGLGDELAP